ncbi:MAG: 2-oxoacid:acceptor oxidoreductase family protein [Syntrophobacteraceae bacterium]|jgi:indolepyruvate ferredoxin oxidoreductase beta subunit|nr:2-oxoacid:acceptor oxidoreductase family protein [Syntrophobacteraceae bacterium]
MQQIIISGVGGQGILFVTRLLAETALEMGFSVLISETHGMAQRGGNVISHLKVSSLADDAVASTSRPFVSPLIRPGRADLLLAMHPDGETAHGFYLKDGGVTISNRPDPSNPSALDAGRMALDLGSPVSANLVLLGFAAGSGALFCPPEQVRATLERFGGRRIELSLKAYEAGWDEARRRLAGGVPHSSGGSAA